MSELRKLAERVDEINDMFRPTLKELDLETKDEIAISTALFDLTIPLRCAILEARERIKSGEVS